MAKPSFSVYTVIKKEGRDDYWLNIGAAFDHQSGDGMTILLQALPTDARLVLRKFTEKPDQTPPPDDAPRRDEEPKRSAYREQSRGR